jgi:hypothetical protein
LDVSGEKVNEVIFAKSLEQIILSTPFWHKDSEPRSALLHFLREHIKAGRFIGTLTVRQLAYTNGEWIAVNITNEPIEGLSPEQAAMSYASDFKPFECSGSAQESAQEFMREVLEPFIPSFTIEKLGTLLPKTLGMAYGSSQEDMKALGALSSVNKTFKQSVGQLMGLGELLKEFNGPPPSSIRPWFLHLAARLKNQDESLEVFEIEYETLSVEEFDLLLKHLALHKASHTLKLNGLNLRDERLSLLVNSLGKKNGLLSLEVRDNFLSEKCATHIAKLVEHHQSLTHIDISTNKLTNSGAFELARQLEKHPSLKNLALNYCGIYKAGCEALTSVAAKRSIPTTVSLTDNPSHIAGPNPERYIP